MILPELGKATVFNTVDGKKGVCLTKGNSKLICFWTPFEQYRWIRFPFGVSTTSNICQMLMYEITNDLDGVEVMADNFLVYRSGDTME